MNGLLVVIALVGGVWFLRELGRTPAHKVKQLQRKMFGYGLLVVAGYFALLGNFIFAVPLIGFGAGLLGWQQVAQKFANSTSNSPQAPSNIGAMDRLEALQVLGLKEGATRDEITSAYKRLQRANHPDTGGSTYLAAKINQARDILLKS